MCMGKDTARNLQWKKVRYLLLRECSPCSYLRWEKSKLDDKSEKFIFVGYDQSSNDYKPYNPTNYKIVIIGDMVFDEEGEWFFGTQKNEYYLFSEFEEETHLEKFNKILTLQHHPLMKTLQKKWSWQVHGVCKISIQTHMHHHCEGRKAF